MSKIKLVEPKVREVLRIGLDEKNQVVVHGQIMNKRLCLFVLADAIKAVYVYEPPKIVKPNIHTIPPTKH